MIPIASDFRFRLCEDREAADGIADSPAIERRRLPGSKGRNVLAWTHRDVPRLLRREPVALAHFPFYTLPLSLPCPAIVTIHDVTFSLHPEWFPLRARVAFGLFAPRAARRAAHVLTVSERSRRDIIERYGVPAGRVTAVPLAAGATFTPRSDEEIERAARLHGLKRPYLLHLGSLHPRRNLDRLLDAFAGLGEEAANVTVVLVGRLERPYRALDPMIRARGLAGRVVHLGYVPDEDLPAIISGALALVYPSLYEGFGLPILEAMACGTPVVTSNVSALPETAGDAALLVDPLSTGEIAKALRSIMTEPDLRARLREAGLARASGFSWRRAAEGTLAVYRSVLGERPSGGHRHGS